MIITVVTPSFNQGEYLAETIESVIGQQGDFSIDYLVVDGGSRDASVEIIRRYERQLADKSRPLACRGLDYRWLSEADRGQSDALVKGFRLAVGEILVWLNSDDVLLPGALQAVADTFRRHQELALVYGDAHYCDAAGRITGRYPAEAFDFGKLAWFNFFCQPATFFRREAFVAVGGLNENLHYAMDYDLFVRIAGRFPCRYLPRYLAKYRLHDQAKTMDDAALLDNHQEALQVALRYFDWAPLNRVYGVCSQACLARWPGHLPRYRLLVVAAALCCTVLRSLRLNRGVRWNDLQLLTPGNLRKLFKSRLDLLQG